MDPIEVLVIHSSKFYSREFLKKLVNKYPRLADSTIYKLRVIKTQSKVQDDILGKRYDRIFFDEDSLPFSKVKEYIAATGHPVAIGISIMAHGSKKKRNMTNITMPIKKLSTK